MRRVSPLLFRQHLSLRLPEACTHEVGRSIRNHTTSSLRNHRFNMARYRFYTRARTLALCPLGIRVFAVEGLSSASLLKKTGSRPSSLPYNNVYSITIYIFDKTSSRAVPQRFILRFLLFYLPPPLHPLVFSLLLNRPLQPNTTAL